MAPDEESHLLSDPSSLDRQDSDQETVNVVQTTGPSIRFAIEPYLLVYSISYSILSTLFPQVLYAKVSETLFNSTGHLDPSLINSTTLDNCEKNGSGASFYDIQKTASLWDSFLNAVGTTIGVFSLLIFGNLSDSYGRKLTFLLPPVGVLLSIIMQLLIIFLHLPLPFFYLTLIFQYSFGSYYLVLLGSFAYVGDVTKMTPPSEDDATTRSKDHSKRITIRMIVLEFIIFGSMAISQYGLGEWIKRSGFTHPYFLTLALQVALFLYALAFIPEVVNVEVTGSLINDQLITHNDRRRSLRTTSINPIRVLTNDDGKGRRWKIVVLIGTYLLHEATQGVGLMTFFVFNVPFCWDSNKLGIYSAINRVAAGLGIIICGVLVARGLAREWILVLSRASCVAFSFYIAFSTTTLMLYIGAPLIGGLLMGGAYIPVTRALLSDCVNSNERGSLFALHLCLCDIFNSLGGVIINNIYSSTLHFMSGFVFIVQGIAQAIALLLTLWFVRKLHTERNEQSN